MFKVKVEELEDLQGTLLYSYDFLLLFNATVGFQNVSMDPSASLDTFKLLTVIHNQLDPWIQKWFQCQ